MASYGTIHRLSTSSSSATMARPEMQADSTRKQRREFVLLRYFGIPSSPETAAVRIVRNLGYFWLYYTLLVWVILFVSLVPRRRLSLLLLVVMTFVTSIYLLLLRVIPYSMILHKIINKWLVLALLAIATAVELIITRAAIHLLVSLSIGVPIIVFHAVLRVSDDLFVNEEASAAGELVPLVHKKVHEDHDSETSAAGKLVSPLSKKVQEDHDSESESLV